MSQHTANTAITVAVKSPIAEFRDPSIPGKAVKLVLWFVGIFAAVLVTGLAAVGRRGNGSSQTWDDTVNTWFLSHHFGLVSTAKVIAVVGDAPVLGVIAVALTLLLFAMRTGLRSLVPLAAYLGGEVIVFGIRLVIKRPRPPTAVYSALASSHNGAIPGVHETSLSFPSGHATACTALFFGLAAMMIAGRRIIWPWIVALLASVAVAGSRLVLGVHWFTDVTVGMVAGMVWGIVVGVTLRLGSKRSIVPRGMARAR